MLINSVSVQKNAQRRYNSLVEGEYSDIVLNGLSQSRVDEFASEARILGEELGISPDQTEAKIKAVIALRDAKRYGTLLEGQRSHIVVNGLSQSEVDKFASEARTLGEKLRISPDQTEAKIKAAIALRDAARYNTLVDGEYSHIVVNGLLQSSVDEFTSEARTLGEKLGLAPDQTEAKIKAAIALRNKKLGLNGV